MASRNTPVSMKDVARHAGVSVTTVSNVLNNTNRLSEATRARVQASIETLGYVRNSAAQQLRRGSSDTIGLVLADAANPFYSSVALGVEDAARQHGGSVISGNSSGQLERERHYLTLFEQHRVRGMVIAPVADQTERIGQFRRRGIRSVIVGRVSAQSMCSSVTVDNVSGGYLAGRHLVDIGRRRLAFVGPPTVKGVGERLSGMTQALEESGRPAPVVLDSRGLSVSAGRDLGHKLSRGSASTLPDGIVCANDLLAIGLLHALISTGGIRIPDDLALIGYDDIDFAASAIVPLTSIRQPAELIGRTAVELLDREQNADEPYRHIMFAPELRVRESTVRP